MWLAGVDVRKNADNVENFCNNMRIWGMLEKIESDEGMSVEKLGSFILFVGFRMAMQRNADELLIWLYGKKGERKKCQIGNRYFSYILRSTLGCCFSFVFRYSF